MMIVTVWYARHRVWARRIAAWIINLFKCCFSFFLYNIA